MDEQFVVQIIAYDGEWVVKEMGPMSERRAERVDDGANRNLDHKNYYTLIKPVGAEETMDAKDIKAEITLWEGLVESSKPPAETDVISNPFDSDFCDWAMSVLAEWEARPGSGENMDEFRDAAKQYIEELYELLDGAS